MKKMLTHLRTSIKFIVLISIGAFLIIGAIAFLYKPIYSVTIDGQEVGYSANKSKLQKKINNYIENGEGDNIAFVQIENMPQYRLCLLKKNIVTNDDEIFDMVKNQGVTYYNYYAILDGQEEQAYVSTFKEAEDIVNDLKEKDSYNVESLSIVEKFETELKDFITREAAVSKLYKEPIKTITVAKSTTTNTYSSTGGKVSTSRNLSSKKIDLGISLSRPISGTISSRFGSNSRVRSGTHTGLDIAAPTGTPIGAAASGTVTFAGRKGSYGNMIVITHDNGVQTYYGHCSKLYAKAGQKVKQGEKIAAVGSTGNSTGPHLHLEVRVNGVAYNPQNYVY